MNRAVTVGASAVALSVTGGCLHADDDVRLTPRTFGEQVVDSWIEEYGLPERARTGGEIFAAIGCLTCHTYLDSGVRSLGGRDLSAIGAKPGRDEAYFARYVVDPRRFGNTVMPRYGSLTASQVEALAAFLETSRGGDG